MDTIHEISKLLQYSPKCSNLFTKCEEEISPETVGLEFFVQLYEQYTMKPSVA